MCLSSKLGNFIGVQFTEHEFYLCELIRRDPHIKRIFPRRNNLLLQFNSAWLWHSPFCDQTAHAMHSSALYCNGNPDTYFFENHRMVSPPQTDIRSLILTKSTNLT